jgi:hypothetical protein
VLDLNQADRATATIAGEKGEVSDVRPMWPSPPIPMTTAQLLGLSRRAAFLAAR